MHRKTLLCPSLQSFSIDAVFGVLIQHRNASRDLLAPRLRSPPVGRTPVLTWAKRTVFAGNKVGEPAQSLDVTRQSENCQQSFFGAQHASVKHFHTGRERLSSRPLHQFEQAGLLRDVPFGIPRAVVGQHSHVVLFRPVTETSSGRRGQMLDDRGTEYLEEKILVRFFVLPAPATFLFGFRTRAHGNHDHAVGFSLLERALEAFAGERKSIHVNGVAFDFEVLRLPRIKPRPAVPCVPVPRPIRQFPSAACEHPAARITEQPHIFLRQHIYIGKRAGQLHGFGYVAHGIGSTGLNWQPSTKKLKKSGWVSRRQCWTLFTRSSNS